MKNVRLFFILIGLYFSCTPIFAQQTIFNVPSADVTEKGHVFVQQEAQFRGWGDDAFFNGTSYFSYGIGHNTDLDVTVFNVAAPDITANTAIGAGFKTSIPVPVLKEKFPAREIKLTIGSEMLFGLENGNGVGNWTYAHLSGRVPKLNTRLTAGYSYGGKQVFGVNHSSFIAGVEQPVTKKLTLLMDWFSGSEHFAGFLIVGGSYALPKKTTIYAGYQLPNGPTAGVSGFVVELAKIF